MFEGIFYEKNFFFQMGFNWFYTHHSFSFYFRGVFKLYANKCTLWMALSKSSFLWNKIFQNLIHAELYFSRPIFCKMRLLFFSLKKGWKRGHKGCIISIFRGTSMRIFTKKTDILEKKLLILQKNYPILL